LPVAGVAIAVDDTNNAAPKNTGLTTRDFHKILDIFPFLLTPYMNKFKLAVADCLEMRCLVETCVLGMAATNAILVFTKLITD